EVGAVGRGSYPPVRIAGLSAEAESDRPAPKMSVRASPPPDRHLSAQDRELAKRVDLIATVANVRRHRTKQKRRAVCPRKGNRAFSDLRARRARTRHREFHVRL